MRAILFVSGTTLLIAVGVLLVWRPVTVLALALLGGALNLWRMHRPHRAAAPRTAVATPLVETEVLDEPESHEVLDHLRDAGWAVHAANTASPWLVAVSGGVRVALRPHPRDEFVTEEDITEALAAKAADGAQFAAIICEHRPADAVAALANDNRIHIVNMLRLEAYLALALSFKPTTTQPAPVLKQAMA